MLRQCGSTRFDQPSGASCKIQRKARDLVRPSTPTEARRCLEQQRGCPTCGKPPRRADTRRAGANDHHINVCAHLEIAKREPRNTVGLSLSHSAGDPGRRLKTGLRCRKPPS